MVCRGGCGGHVSTPWPARHDTNNAAKCPTEPGNNWRFNSRYYQTVDLGEALTVSCLDSDVATSVSNAEAGTLSITSIHRVVKNVLF